jgi:alkanesulfonate monooxygenase SsuD/methylene tetrahydromethanopterin reductase-like flavin-dependent oxidoreductase (luciferase family)
LWEAHDLIIKAMTTHDGPFNWEGEHYHHRQVNIWPRPIQQPHPPVWSSTGSPSSVDKIAEKNATVTAMNSGLRAKGLFARYRQKVAEAGRPRPKLDKFAYMSLVAVADTQAEAFRRLDKIRGYLRTTTIVGKGLANPPGYAAAAINADLLANPQKGELGIIDRDAKPVNLRTAPHEALIDAGAAFAGTPDQVIQQIKRFHNDIGGIGNFIMMGQGGDLTHQETLDNLGMFAREVTPALQELKEPEDAAFEANERVRERAAG